MRRLVPGLVLTVLLTFAVLAPTAAFAADTTSSGATMLLATEGGEVGGLEPGEPNNPENSFAPVDYEGNFLWGFGGVILLGLLAIGFGIMGALYYLLVYKANEKKASA